jgi:hypothetical protein
MLVEQQLLRLQRWIELLENQHIYLIMNKMELLELWVDIYLLLQILVK